MINPLTALFNVPNGALLDSRFRDVVLRLTKEFIDVANARGTRLGSEEPSVESGVAHVLGVAEATAQNTSSMLAEVRRHPHNEPAELDSITGAVVTEARRLSVPAPTHERVFQLLKSGGFLSQPELSLL